jgi:hypothetical protein
MREPEPVGADVNRSSSAILDFSVADQAADDQQADRKQCRAARLWDWGEQVSTTLAVESAKTPDLAVVVDVAGLS